MVRGMATPPYRTAVLARGPSLIHPHPGRSLVARRPALLRPPCQSHRSLRAPQPTFEGRSGWFRRRVGRLAGPTPVPWSHYAGSRLDTWPVTKPNYFPRKPTGATVPRLFDIARWHPPFDPFAQGQSPESYESRHARAGSITRPDNE